MAKLNPWNEGRVIEQLRWMWENGTVVRRRHFRDELEAAGASMLDIETIIFGCPKVANSEWDPEHRCYKYRICGEDLGGMTLDFVVSFDLGNSRLFLITAF